MAPRSAENASKSCKRPPFDHSIHFMGRRIIPLGLDSTPGVFTKVHHQEVLEETEHSLVGIANVICF